MNDILNEGVYLWLDGSPYEPEMEVYQYCRWKPGEPSDWNDGSHPQGQDCVIVERSRVFTDIACDRSWYQGLCQRAKFVC